jgi:hypothetical protein
VAVIIAWPLKRSALARLAAFADGTKPIPHGLEVLLAPLVSTSDVPVEVSYAIPDEPDRVCVYGTPLRASRAERTAEAGGGYATNSGMQAVVAETVTLELRARVYEPGDNIEGVDRLLGDVCQAVATALTYERLFAQGAMALTSVTQDPTAVSPSPDPYVIGNALLTFTAQVVTV